MGIRNFISEENLTLHKEYLEALRLKKRMLMGALNVRRVETDIKAHELYFSSFCEDRIRCDLICKSYGSENRFCFLLKEYAEKRRGEFLYLYPLCRFPFVGYGTEDKLAYRAVLAIDLCEHAYFLDYGFDYLSYIEAALSHLDLKRLNRKANE